MRERIKKIKELAKVPMEDDHKLKRVEIIILKFKEDPEIIDKCVSLILHNTKWPFKLNIFDNRPNSANTSRIWNKLIRESTCDYVCIIDSDAFVPATDPCWLTRLMESVDVTGCIIPMGDNAGGSNKAQTAKPYPSQPILDTGIWSGFCFVIKKSLWQETGGFDEDFYFYGQDSEFANRLKRKNGTLIRPDVLVRHIGSYSGKKAETEGSFDREADKLYASALYRLKISGKVKTL